MHCIFVGAQSLFLKSLIQDTSADLCVLDTGLLGIRGSAEAVVMARSHIQQFVKLFENNENLPNSQKMNSRREYLNPKTTASSKNCKVITVQLSK